MFNCNMNPKIDSPWSWFVTLSCFLMNGLTFGLSCSFGIFYVALLEDFPGKESETAWVVSLDYSMSMLVSPLTIYLCRRLTPRAVCCFGVLLTATSFYLASKAANLVTLYCTFGVMFGLATNLSHLPTIFVLRTNFKKHLAVAMAIGVAGTGAGGIIFSLLLPRLIEARGWRGTLNYLTYIALGFAVCGLVLFPSEQETALVAEPKPKKHTSSSHKKSGFKKLYLGIVSLGIPSSWHNKAFVALNTALVLTYFVISIVYCHIVNFAIQQGLSLLEASKMSLCITVGSTIGRLSVGPMTNIPGINRVLLGQGIFLGLCITVTLCPLATSAAWLMLLSGLLGFFDGNVTAMVPLLVDDVFLDKNQAMVGLGHLFALYSLPYALGSPLAGWLYSVTGSYHTVFFSCGAFLFIASCLMSFVYFFLPTSRRKTVVSEDVVTLSLTGRCPSRDLDSNSNRLFNLRMCSWQDLSAEIFFADTRHSRTGASDSQGCAYGNLLSVPQVHPEEVSEQIQPWDHDSEGLFQLKTCISSATEPVHYTDIDDQISGQHT